MFDMRSSKPERRLSGKKSSHCRYILRLVENGRDGNLKTINDFRPNRPAARFEQQLIAAIREHVLLDGLLVRIDE